MEGEKLTWVWGGIALAAGVGLVMAIGAAGKKRLASGSRLVLIGDSLAEGLSVPLGELAKEAGVVFSSDSVSGSTITTWARRAELDKDLDPVPELVLVSLGTNDLRLKDVSPEEPLLHQLLARITDSGAAVLWIAPPSMPFADNGTRALLSRAGADVFSSEPLDIARGPDGVHPTAMGYAGWAAAIWRVIA